MQEVPLLQPPDLRSATPASQPEVPSPPQPTLPPQHFLSSHSQATETPSLFLELGEELQHPHMQKPPRSSTLRGWADGTFESSSACLACLPVSSQHPRPLPDPRNPQNGCFTRVLGSESPEPLPASWGRRCRTQYRSEVGKFLTPPGTSRRLVVGEVDPAGRVDFVLRTVGSLGERGALVNVLDPAASVRKGHCWVARRPGWGCC